MSKTVVSKSNLIKLFNSKFKTNFKEEDGTILRKELFTSDVTSTKEDGQWGYCDCIVTCEVVDRSGDLVIASGVNTTNFQRIPSIYISHNYASLPIGTCESLTHKDNSIEARAKFLLTIPEIKYIWERIKNGVLKGVSVGFEVKEMLIRGTREFENYVKENLGRLSQEDKDRLQRIFTKWDLMEYSICGVPANQACYIKSLPEVDENLKSGLSKYGYELIGVKDMSVEIKKDEEVVEAKDEKKPCDCEGCKGKDCKDEECKCDCHKDECKEDEDRNPSKDEEDTKKDAAKDECKDEEVIDNPKKEEDDDEDDEEDDEEDDDEDDGKKPLVVKPKPKDEEAKEEDEEEEDEEDEDDEDEEDEEKPKKPEKSSKKKEIMSYWEVIRTPEEVETFINKSVQAKLSGKINITFNE